MDNTDFVRYLSNTGLRVTSYSGRGMFGSKCVAVVLGNDDSDADFVLQVIDQAQDGGLLDDMGYDIADLCDALRQSRHDQMGLGRVIYWPNHKWDDAITSVASDLDDDGEEE